MADNDIIITIIYSKYSMGTQGSTTRKIMRIAA